MEAGIVNILGGPLGYVGSGSYIVTQRAIQVTKTGWANEGAAVNPSWSREFNFDASRSSSIYGNSETVTPLSTSCSFLIRF